MKRVLYRPFYAKIPGLSIKFGDIAYVQYWKILHLALSRWDSGFFYHENIIQQAYVKGAITRLNFYMLDKLYVQSIICTIKKQMDHVKIA